MEKEKVKDDEEKIKEETPKKDDEKGKIKEEAAKEEKEKEKEKVKIIFPLYLIYNEENSNSIEFNNNEESERYSKILKIDNKEYLLLINRMEIIEDKNTKQYEIQFKWKDNNYKIIIEKNNKLVFTFKVKLEKINFSISNLFNTTINQELGYKNTFIAFYEFIEKYGEKEKYEKILINEGINIFKEVKTFDFFILLFSHCYDKPSIQALFSAFPQKFEIAIINDDIMLKNLKTKMEKIYQQKNEIFKIIKKEKEKKDKKTEKDKEKKKEEKKVYEKDENIFYLTFIYYYLLIGEKETASKYIEELKKENKQILYEILKKHSYLFEKYNIINKELLNELLSDSLETEFKNLKNALRYEKNILEFLEIIYKNINNIFNISKKDLNNTINILDFVQQNKDDNIRKLVQKINELTEYQKKEGFFFIEFNQTFWKFYLDYLNEIEMENIDKLIELRKCFNKYQSSLNDSKIETSIDKKSIKKYYSYDYYASSIHQTISNLIKKDNFNNLEKIKLIFEKDPFYLEESKKKSRSVNVLECINFKNQKECDDKFFSKLNQLQLDVIFEYQIKDYFKFIFRLINDIFDFDLLYKLFCLDKMKQNNVNEYIKNLKNKFHEIKININTNNTSEYESILNSIIKLIKIIIMKEEAENIIKFLTNILEKKFNEKTVFDIYIKLLESLETNESIPNEIMSYILSKFILKSDFSKKFFKTIKNENIIKNFYDIINIKNLNFDFDDFFNNKKDNEIKYFISLNEEKLISENSEFYKKNNKTIQNLKEKFEKFEIKKTKIEEFLKLEKLKIIQRLKLINSNPNELYEKLNEKIKKINKEIKNLEENKGLLSIYKIQTKDIDELITSLKNNNLNEIDNKEKTINYVNEHYKEYIEKIKKVKDSLFFEMLYNKNKKDISGSDNNNFSILKNSFNELDKNSKIIEDPEVVPVETLKKFLECFQDNKNYNNKEINKEIQILSKYYNAENIDLNITKDKMEILINKNLYCQKVRNILFFLEKINSTKTDFSKKLNKMIEEIEDNKVEKQYNKIKSYLAYLKYNDIFDYQDYNENDNDKFYSNLYPKEFAISYLLKKDAESISHLSEKLDPFETNLNIDDIQCFENCVNFIKNLNIKASTDLEIFHKIKKTIKSDKKILNYFEKYSIIYSSIQDLDENFDEQISTIKEIEININKGIYYFYKLKDKYKLDGQTKENGYQYLYDLKCKISNYKNGKETDEKKINKLKYFENLVDNIRTIKYFVNFLRNKGSQIDLIIEVHFCYNQNTEEGKFIFGKEEKSFIFIKKYLIDIYNNYNKILSEYYNNNEYIRFAYGKQYNFIVDYLEANNNDNSFANYFLNKMPKKELERGNPIETKLSIKNYQIYLENTLRNISKYICDYFKDNYGSLEKFYENYKVKNLREGIYFLNSENTSLEKATIDIFQYYIEKYPISQNVLIINKYTSYEEIESFLYRSILCKYHSLFIIGLNDLTSSQEDCLLKNINNIIKKINKNNGDEIDIKSCVIFVYNEYQSKNKFIGQLKNINKEGGSTRDLTKEYKNIQKEKKINPNSEIKNIFVYLSDVNGTGKTFAIKEDIRMNNLIYIYFHFGGFLSKKIIYQRINELLHEIKNYDDINKIAIHLDLYETEEKNLMNDFLFSFLFTKYYKNDENVIYIPRELNIYIEIPNCFNNFIENYTILKIFKGEQRKEINLRNQRPFKLEKQEEKILEQLNIKNIEEFIHKNIGIKNPSYYQKRQFLNSFLCQITPDNAPHLLSNKDIFEKKIKATKYFIENSFSDLLKEENDGKEKSEDQILEKISSIQKKEDSHIPIIFFNNKEFFEVSMDEENKSRQFYLAKFKEIFNLNNPIKTKDLNSSDLKSIEEIIGNEYVITSDNFKKMVLIYYRILSNLNLIIMGETGCGKTLLISKIYELLNNGEKLNKNYKINIHGGYTDEDITKKIIAINKNINKENINKKKWVFIDEINACKSMSLFNEIICNHSCKGKKLNENLVFIGACNPYRKVNKTKDIIGLIHSGIKQNNLLYNVNPLSFSLMNFVFYFGSLSKPDEEKYIGAIIEVLFEEDEEDLKEITKNIIFTAHTFVRDKGDVSSVSLRELSKFKQCFYFFQEYYENKKKVLTKEEIEEEKLKDEKIVKIKSIILSLYICYYLKISDLDNREKFDTTIKSKVIEIKLMKNLLENVNDNSEKKKYFSSILELEERFILKEIKLENGIAENRPLRDNAFLLFVSINLNIPIFLIGKPGSSKTLSVNLIDKAMIGKFSNNIFFRNYPKIFKIWFQGSETTSTRDVENLFKDAEQRSESFKNLDYYGQHPITYIFFDEIGLCEVSDKKPLKILNFKFEYENKKKYLSFIGASNWNLDASKMNRGFTLLVPELHENKEDVDETCKKIVINISPNLWTEETQKIFEALVLSYIKYKKYLKVNNIEESENPLCHGSRDFYFLIKNVAYNLLNTNKENNEINKIIEIVKSAIERNFGALYIKDKKSSEIFKEYFLNEYNNDEFKSNIDYFKTDKDVIKNIISNIIDKNSRNLLLITKSSLNLLLVNMLREKLEQLYEEKKINKIIPIYKIGSSFEEDKGEEYKIKIINQIIDHAKNGDVLIIQNYSKILPFFYELFNLNYSKKDGKNYARLSIGK